MGSCCSSDAQAVYPTDDEGEMAHRVKEKERLRNEALRYLDALKSRDEAYLQGLEWLQSKDADGIAQLLGVFLTPTISKSQGIPQQLCKIPGSELKYGRNNVKGCATASDPEPIVVDILNTDLIMTKEDVIKAYERRTVDRSGEGYFALLHSHWNKFDSYRFSYMSGLPYLCWNSNNNNYVRNPSIQKRMGPCIGRGQYKTHTQPSASTAAAPPVREPLDSSAAEEVLQCWNSEVLDANSGVKSGSRRLCSIAVKDRNGSSLMQMFSDLWDHGVKRQKAFGSEVERETVTTEAVDFQNEVVDGVCFSSNAKNVDVLKRSLRDDKDADTGGVADEPFSKVFTSQECEQIYLRKPNRIDFWFRHMHPSLRNDENSPHVYADIVVDNVDEATTGAHIVHTAGTLTKVLPRKENRTKIKKYNGYEYRYDEQYDLAFKEEVRYIIGHSPELANDLYTKPVEHTDALITLTSRNTTEHWGVHTHHAPDPLEYQRKQSQLRKLRCIIRRSAQRNARYKYKEKHAHSAYRHLENETPRVEPTPRAGSADDADGDSGKEKTHPLHLHRPKVPGKPTELEARREHSFNLYAHMQFFLYNIEQSRKHLNLLAAKQHLFEAREERRKVRAANEEKRRMQKEQEQEKKRLEQVAVDEKMAKKFGNSGKDASKVNDSHDLEDKKDYEHSEKDNQDDGFNEDLKITMKNELLNSSEENTGEEDRNVPETRIDTATGREIPMEEPKTYYERLMELTPADIGHTSFGSGSTWSHLDLLIQMARERLEGGSHVKHMVSHDFDCFDENAAALRGQYVRYDFQAVRPPKTFQGRLALQEHPSIPNSPYSGSRIGSANAVGTVTSLNVPNVEEVNIQLSKLAEGAENIDNSDELNALILKPQVNVDEDIELDKEAKKRVEAEDILIAKECKRYRKRYPRNFRTDHETSDHYEKFLNATLRSLFSGVLAPYCQETNGSRSSAAAMPVGTLTSATYRTLLDNDILFKLVCNIREQITADIYDIHQQTITSIVQKKTQFMHESLRNQVVPTRTKSIDSPGTDALTDSAAGQMRNQNKRKREQGFRSLDLQQTLLISKVTNTPLHFATAINTHEAIQLSHTKDEESYGKNNETASKSTPNAFLKTSSAARMNGDIFVTSGDGSAIAIPQTHLTVNSWDMDTYVVRQHPQIRGFTTRKLMNGFMASLLEKAKSIAEKSPSQTSSRAARGSQYIWQAKWKSNTPCINIASLVPKYDNEFNRQNQTYQTLTLSSIIDAVFTRSDYSAFTGTSYRHLYQRKREIKNSLGSRRGIPIGTQIILNFENGFRPSAKIRCYAHNFSDPNEVSSDGTMEDFLIEKQVLLHNWKAIKDILSIRNRNEPNADADERSEYILELKLQKLTQ